MPRTTRRAPRPCSRPSSRSNSDEIPYDANTLARTCRPCRPCRTRAVELYLRGSRGGKGAGASFPNIIYQDWILTYNQAHPDAQLNYQSIGSGGGIRQFSDGTVDFGATDAPMRDSAITAINGNVLHIPTVMGGVVPTYNLPDVTTALKFSPEVLAGIYLGTITKWNDARITSLNEGVKLPDQDIVVVHRSDGSGTSFVF